MRTGRGGGGEQGAPCGRRPVPETLAPSEAEARAAAPSRALMGDRHEATVRVRRLSVRLPVCPSVCQSSVIVLLSSIYTI